MVTFGKDEGIYQIRSCRTWIAKVIAGGKMVSDPLLDAHSVFVKCADFASEKWALATLVQNRGYIRS